jgi:hypothetical protein
MSGQTVNFRDIVQRVPAATDDIAPVDLWPRIAAAHLRRRRQRRLGLTGAGLALAAGLAVAILIPALRSPDNAAAIDWQARAQALEMQIDTLPMPSAGEGSVARTTVSEIARIDRDLQAAYDRGGAKNILVPLWKRRSELLDNLLVERQQQNTQARI